MANRTKVFISYSHDTDEHKNRVLELSDRLCLEGIDCIIDEYEVSPIKGWLQWMEDQIEEAEYVLVVCTQNYHDRLRMKIKTGKGATWEGAVINQIIYDNFSLNTKFIPVIMVHTDSEHIPTILRKDTYYNLSTEDGYDDLYRKLTYQPLIEKPELGAIKSLPKRERKQEFASIEHNSFHNKTLHNLPPRNPYYTGREEYLAQIEGALKRNSQAAITQTQAICGLGGIGKTQTAIEYAYRHQNEYSHIFWVIAETQQDIIAGFSEMARLLDLPQKDAQDQNLIVQAAQQWMQQHSGWLLILDNADDLHIVQPFVPSSGKGQCLLTTRSTIVGCIADKIPLDKMSDDEGAVFLLRRINKIKHNEHLHDASGDDPSSAKKLSHELDGFPLALDQAAAYINETQSHIDGYLELYRSVGARLLKERGEFIREHPDPVTKTFLISFVKVEQKNPAAADLIRGCAFLAADEIPEELFTDAAEHWGERISQIGDDPLAYDRMVKEATRYALIERNPATHTFNIHRLVQEVIRAEMDDDTQRKWAERTVKALNAIFPYTKFENWNLCERLTPQAQEIAKWVEKWTIEIEEAGRLFNQVALYLKLRARYTEADVFYRKAIAIYEINLGSEHTNVATCLNNLALLLSDQGKVDEANELYRKTIAIDEKALGLEHPNLARDYNNLAGLLREQDKVEEAKELYRNAIAILEKSLGNEHPNLANAYNNLAGLLREQDKVEEAKELYRNAIAIDEKALGLEHPDLAIDYNNLAGLLRDQGKVDEAEELFRKAIVIMENALPDHPNHATILMKYADLLRATKRHAEAAELEAKAQAIRARHAEMNPKSFE